MNLESMFNLSAICFNVLVLVFLYREWLLFRQSD
jgi:hypothetical protein